MLVRDNWFHIEVSETQILACHSLEKAEALLWFELLLILINFVFGQKHVLLQVVRKNSRIA